MLNYVSVHSMNFIERKRNIFIELLRHKTFNTTQIFTLRKNVSGVMGDLLLVHISRAIKYDLQSRKVIIFLSREKKHLPFRAYIFNASEVIEMYFLRHFSSVLPKIIL